MKVSIKGLNVTMHTAATDDVRVYLIGVVANKNYLASTNGHIASRYKHYDMVAEFWENDNDIIIPLKNVKNFTRYVGKNYNDSSLADIVYKNGKYCLTYTYEDKKDKKQKTIIEPFTPIDAKYPDVERLFYFDERNQTSINAIGFNGEYLNILYKIALLCSKMPNLKFKFNSNKSQVLVSVKDPNVDCIIMPIRLENNFFKDVK